jgi:hypothetical protein
MDDNKNNTSPQLTIDNIFAGYLTYPQIESRAMYPLVVTDCLEDENPHLTIGIGEEGAPIWQMHQLINRKFVLTDFDTEELPPMGSEERVKLFRAIEQHRGWA